MLRSVRRVFEEYYSLRERLRSCPSGMGAQLETASFYYDRAARYYDGAVKVKDDGAHARRQLALEERYRRYWILHSLMCELTAEERMVGWLRFIAYNGIHEFRRIVHESELRPVDLFVEGEGECKATTASGMLCHNPRLTGEASCHIPAHRLQRAAPPTYRTREGDEIVRMATLLDGYGAPILDESGEQVAGYVEVHAVRAKALTLDEIADIAQISRRHIRTIVTSIHSKLEAAAMYGALTNEEDEDETCQSSEGIRASPQSSRKYGAGR